MEHKDDEEGKDGKDGKEEMEKSMDVRVEEALIDSASKCGLLHCYAILVKCYLSAVYLICV